MLQTSDRSSLAFSESFPGKRRTCLSVPIGIKRNQGLAVYTLHPIVSQDPEQETKQCHDVMAVALEAFFLLNSTCFCAILLA